MRNLASLLVAVAALAVLPEAYAQARCHGGRALCIGDKTTDLYIQGNVYASSPDGGSVTITPGAMTNPLTQTLSGTSSSSGTAAPAVIDAGTAWIRGGLQVVGNLDEQGTSNFAGVDAGTILVRGVAQVVGDLILGSSTTKTTCTLGGQSPSTCTATVRAGSTCTCSPVGASAAIAAAGCALGLSGTTLTVTSLNGGSHVVNLHCF